MTQEDIEKLQRAVNLERVQMDLEDIINILKTDVVLGLCIYRPYSYDLTSLKDCVDAEIEKLVNELGEKYK